MDKCSYGCGNEGLFQLKNGKFCCSKSHNSCPSNRKSNSKANKGKFRGTKAWEIPGFEYNPWNKGTHGLYSDEYRRKISESLTGVATGRGSTPETEKRRRSNISISMKANPNGGGLRRGSGRGKKGWYKGYWCDSTWELAWVIYHLDHNIPFSRNRQAFDYTWNGKKRKYYPDFLLEDGTFVEIKGYNSKQFEQKKKEFTEKLLVYDKNNIDEILTYTIDKYGKDFHTLYESERNRLDEGPVLKTGST